MNRDPVVAKDGHTYERSAITTWLETHKTSPMVRVCCVGHSTSFKGLAHKDHSTPIITLCPPSP